MPQHNRQKFICAPPRRQMCPTRIVHKRGTNASGPVVGEARRCARVIWPPRALDPAGDGRLKRAEPRRTHRGRRLRAKLGVAKPATPRRLSSVSRFSTCRVTGRRSRANAFELWLQLRSDKVRTPSRAPIYALCGWAVSRRFDLKYETGGRVVGPAEHREKAVFHSLN